MNSINFNVFGDSHSIHTWKDIHIDGVNIIIHHLGPLLMYSVGNKDRLFRNSYNLVKIDENGLPDLQINNGDYLCFCFGEIDCRSHIYKHTDEIGASYQPAIDEIVKNYFTTIELCQKKYPNVKFCVYNVVPTPKRDSIINPPLGFKHIGNDEQRRNYVTYMNKKLKEYCELNNYIFVDIHDFYLLNGYLNPNCFDGTAHIKNPCFLEMFLKTLFSIE